MPAEADKRALQRSRPPVGDGRYLGKVVLVELELESN
jgi:hypothetical protein